MKIKSIGILGGFGPFATLDFFRRFLERFQSNCDRNYPHIIMDNNFKMPSRTKALLDGTDYEIIVQAMAHSMQLMLQENVEKILMVCGTAHCFLDDVFKIVPEAESRLIHIVDALGEEMQSNYVEDSVVIAAEGALKYDLYGTRLKRFQISCETPSQTQYPILRLFIESVKQNKIDDRILQKFLNFLEGYSSYNVILGCTEFPVIVHALERHPVLQSQVSKYRFWDPLDAVLNMIK